MYRLKKRQTGPVYEKKINSLKKMVAIIVGNTDYGLTGQEKLCQ